MINIFSTVLTDAAYPWQLGFQDPASPIIEGIINLHNYIFFFVIFVFVAVAWLLGRILWHFNANANKNTFVLPNASLVEVTWTLVPILILILIAIPSFSLLYAQDAFFDPAITIKVIGHQWYWSYEYSDFATSDEGSVTFDSYIVPSNELTEGQLRLLEVDERVVVPVDTHVRVIITSADVLHSWAVPSIGIKIDAVPGRLNQTSMFVNRPGVFYGQCSEICGANHGFIPIVVQAVNLEDYINWLVEPIIESDAE